MKRPKATILIGPPGSGKSAYSTAAERDFGAVRVSQDDHGKGGHKELFQKALSDNKDVVIDRMNFGIEQRKFYLEEAKNNGYQTEIIILHENYNTCLERCIARKNHPTITEEQHARNALQIFFTKYNKPAEDEADHIRRMWPDRPRLKAAIFDLDSTLCNIDHRLHHVQKSEGTKKDWASFFRGIPEDTVNQWCMDIANKFSSDNQIVFCSGRGDNERRMTVEWLNKHCEFPYDLYMRNRVDRRPDYVVKEIILDFELKTRYNINFVVDDRPSVCRMWRANQLVVLQCNDVEF